MLSGGFVIKSFAFYRRLEKTVSVMRQMLETTTGDCRGGGDRLVALFGWFSQFRHAETSVEDGGYSGRPSHVAQMKTSRKLTESSTKTDEVRFWGAVVGLDCCWGTSQQIERESL